MNHAWRLLRTGQHNAAMNMAIDEALLLSQESSPQPTLRFYDWSQPALSFGYFQRIAHEVDVDACAARGIELVRRMTGGGTVVHGWDVTYAVAVPHNGVLPKSISASYSAISGCLISGFQRIGVPNPQIEALTEHASQEKRTGTDLANICLTNPAKYDVMLKGEKNCWRIPTTQPDWCDVPRLHRPQHASPRCISARLTATRFRPAP